MAVDQARSHNDRLYAGVFRQYVHRKTQVTLESLRIYSAVLPTEDVNDILRTLEFALGLPEAWPQTRELLILLAPKLEQAGFLRDFVPFLQRGIEQCEANGDTATQGELELLLGLFLIVMGRMPGARHLFQICASRFQDLGDRHNQARALNRWAYVERLQNQADNAASLVDKAMSLVSADDTETTYGQFVLGCLAMDRHDWSEALVYLRQALTGWQMHDDPVMIARSYTNLGSALRGAGKHDEAASSYSHAIGLMVKLGDMANVAATRMNLGNVYREQGRMELALEQYNEAEQFFRRTEDHLRLSRLNLNIGLVYIEKSQLQLAERALSAAIDSFQLLGDPRALANAMDALAVVYLLQDLPEMALSILEQAKTELHGLENRPGVVPLISDIEGHISQAKAKQALNPAVVDLGQSELSEAARAR